MEYLIGTDTAQTPQGLHLHVRQVSTTSSYYQKKAQTENIEEEKKISTQSQQPFDRNQHLEV